MTYSHSNARPMIKFLIYGQVSGHTALPPMPLPVPTFHAP